MKNKIENSENLLISICARGGSKGIPGKNIRHLDNKPLIAYSIEMALSLRDIYGADVGLSTDSEQIKLIAKEFGLNTDYHRPSELGSDVAGKIAVIKDLMLYEERFNHKKYDLVIDLDVTSPLRRIADIDKALSKLKINRKAVNIFSVSPAARNPYFNMVELDENGFAQLVKKTNLVKSRQNAPKVYDMNASFGIYKKSYFDLGYEINTTENSLAYVMDHICFDIDEPIDFKIMELILQHNLWRFED